ASAGVEVLEPIMTTEVTVAGSHIGDVTAELSARRGQVRGTAMLRLGRSRVTAQVPLSELEGFPARLKSLSAGEATYTLAFSHYEPAPAPLQQQLVAAHTPTVEE